MFIVGDIRVEDLRLEIELWWLEWVIGRKDEKELELSALYVLIRTVIIDQHVSWTYSIWGILWAVQNDIPVVDVRLVN